MKVEIKRLTENELEVMMYWRMRSDITFNMFSDPVLTIEGQKKWFTSISDKKDQIRWVVYVDDIPVGSIYLFDIDYANKKCEFGWFIAVKESRSITLAISLICNVFNYAFDILNMNRVYALQFNSNIELPKLFKMCGCSIEGVMKRYCIKNGEPRDIAIIAILKEEWFEKREKMKYQVYNVE